MLSNGVQALAEQATRAVRDAADATAYAQEVERRVKAVATSSTTYFAEYARTSGKSPESSARTSSCATR